MTISYLTVVIFCNVEYDEAINTSLIKRSNEKPVVPKPSSNHAETMHNKNLSFENFENYIDEKYDQAAMSHLKH